MKIFPKFRPGSGQLSGQNAQGVSSLVWAFSKAGSNDSDLFVALASEVTRKLDQFNAQDVANTIYGFAKACCPDPVLFEKLAARAVILMSSEVKTFNAQDLVNTSWGLAKTGSFQNGFWDKVAAHPVLLEDSNNLEVSQVASLAWAFARAGRADKTLFQVGQSFVGSGFHVGSGRGEEMFRAENHVFV